MIWSDSNDIVNKMNKAIQEIKGYGNNVDGYVNNNFRQFLTNGEYDDNSIEVANYFNTLKKIEADKDFSYKLKFVLQHFARGMKL